MKKVFLFFRELVKKIDFLLSSATTEAVEVKNRFVKENKWYFNCETTNGSITFPVSVKWYKSSHIQYVEFTYIKSRLFRKKIHGLKANLLSAAAHEAAVFLTKIQK
jgi:hypothetical protein